ncbi:HAMP domain-containing protein [Paenibacillus albidus]|uniref:HAMP domain-containing protein n=1 Tax=Paenibacillus albidus TaxID=2041023 RepID=UPI00288BE68E|nr:HAMP domain-containing protein [Paenibacillus albidus]
MCFWRISGLYTPSPAGEADTGGGVWLIAYFVTVSVLVSVLASHIFSRIPLSPIREVTRASQELAKGHFAVRIHLKGPKELKKLNESINNLAEELGSLAAVNMKLTIISLKCAILTVASLTTQGGCDPQLNEKGAGPQSLFMTFGTTPLQDYNVYQGVSEALSKTVPFGTATPP